MGDTTGESASVAIVDVDVDMAERTAAELISDSGQAIAVDCDVADPEKVDAAAFLFREGRLYERL